MCRACPLIELISTGSWNMEHCVELSHVPGSHGSTLADWPTTCQPSRQQTAALA